ncbi:MAG: serpin family protein [Bacteroidetes bacterium]|nr:MAG: serpin family protein [Bacteroidota bacterium]
MKTIKFIFLAIIISVFFGSCEKNENPSPHIPDINLNLKEQSLVNSSNKFGFDLLNEINKTEEQNKNIFVSPLSVSFALAMTYNGADNETKTAMEQALRLNGLTTDEINSSFKNIMNSLIGLDPKVTLNIANSIWYRENFHVEQNFIDVNRDYYDAEVNALDFGAPQAKDIINNWVATNTNNKIKKIIDELSTETVMILINAIYFKGNWKYKFEKDATDIKPFYLADGTTKKVLMMQQEGDFNYLSTDLFTAIELPYGDEKFSMLIMLPKQDKTTNDIINELNDNNWNTWINNFEKTNDINVIIPKFKFKYDKILNDVLKNMGMEIAFMGGADFAKINPSESLSISKVIHKTYVDVNEDGTEAAAVTAVLLDNCVGPANIFNANKPFIFAIKEKSTNSILFIGKLANPDYE